MDDSFGRCVLAHRGFGLLGEVIFQRSETDRVPVAVVPLGGRAATVPLRALQREFEIDDDSDDGRMLALIAESLDYVVSLQPGDPLPAEVLTGEASWEPAERHLAAARQWLRACVLRWTAAASRPADLTAALGSLAPLIGAATGEQAAATLESLAFELSFIEACRELLLGRVRRMGQRLERLRLDSGPGVQREELTYSRRLAATAPGTHRRAVHRRRVANVRHRHRAAPGRRAAHLSAFEPRLAAPLAPGLVGILENWDREPEMNASQRRALIASTYRFLAQRYMSVQEWRSAEQRKTAKTPQNAFEW